MTYNGWMCEKKPHAQLTSHKNEACWTVNDPQYRKCGITQYFDFLFAQSAFKMRDLL